MLAEFEIVWNDGQEPIVRLSNSGPDSLITRAALPGEIDLFLIGALYYKTNSTAEGKFGQHPSDAEYALSIYRRHGEAGLEQLEGEFALVLYDRQRQSISAIRDPLGSWPIYWSKKGRSFCVATSIRTLARHRSTQVNLNSVGQYLMQPFAFTELSGEETMLNEISRLPAGHRLSVNNDRNVKVSSYWDWEAEVYGAPTADNLSDAATQFAEILRKAVIERTQRGRISSHLSGGMDSSSIFCLARDEVARHGERIAAIAGVYKMPSIAFERDFIDLVLKQGGPVNPIFINGDEELDYDWFGNNPMPAHDEPYPGIFRIACERSLINAAKQANASVVLTGAAADDLLGADRWSVCDLIRQGRPLSAWKEAGRKAAGSNQNILPIFMKLGILPALPAFLQDGLGPIFNDGYGSWPRLGSYVIPPWIRHEFSKRYGLRKFALGICQQTNRYPSDRSFRCYSLRTGSGDFSSWYLGAPYGIRNSHPFLDLRVIRFCLSLPRDVKSVPGRMKPVLSDAMKGVLPEEIRTRRVKGHFNDVFWNGFSRSLPQLEEMVQNSAIRDLELFDTQKLISIMRQHALGVGDAHAGGRINSTLALIGWYDQWQRWSSSSQKMAFSRRQTESTLACVPA